MNSPEVANTRTQTRLYSAHHDFLLIAESGLRKSNSESVPNYDELLIRITFSAFAVEAVANAIGESEVDHWRRDFEALAPMSKLRLVADKLGIACHRSEGPWNTLVWLLSLRNRLAHAKPETVENVDYPESFEVSNFSSHDPPRSKLEREITLENTRQAHAAVRAMIQIFSNQPPLSKHLGVISNGWHMSVQQVLLPPKHDA